jgi:hypothetical protein
MKQFRQPLPIFIVLVAFACSVAFAGDQRGELPAPVKSVYEHYISIQQELAKDSTKGVSENANAIATAVKNGDVKDMPPEIGSQAEAVANAKDIKAARQAFKPLSASMAKYLSDHKLGKGTYHEAYCPMAKANWLQTGKEVRNPYYGKSMLDCGELRN